MFWIAEPTIRFQCNKTFIFVADEVAKQNRTFVPDKSFQPSLIFVSKAGTYPNEIDFKFFPFSLASCFTLK